MDIYLFQRKTLKHLIECELSYITTGLFTMADQRHVSFIGNGENRNGRENVPSQPATTAAHFRDFWRSSSLQGLPRVFTSTVKFWKFFWFVLFLLLVSGCIYQMWSIFDNYYAYETTTSVGIAYKQLPFPSITICNVNPVRHSQLMEQASPDVRHAYVNMHNKTKGHDADIYTNRNTQIYGMLSFLDGIEPSTQLEMGHQINPMLQSCMMNEYPCSYHNFTQSLSTEYGSCYTLNSADDKHRKGPLMISHTGVYYGGVDLYLFAEEKEYLRGLNFGRGFRMDIHPFNTLSQVESHPIAVATGSETFIKVKMTDIFRLEPPYGQCSKEYAKSFTDMYGYQYSVEACNDTCRDYKIGEECGCMFMKSTKLYAKHQRHLPSCKSSPQLSECGDNVWITEGNCTCPLPCFESRYDYYISSNLWGSTDSYDDIVSQLCRLEVNASSPTSNCAWLNSAEVWQRQERLRNNFAKVSIYFDALLYDEIRENATYDWSQFMADFGGNIGLWIGASIFTILEFVELFTKICVSKIQRTDGTRKSVFDESRRQKSTTAAHPNLDIPL